MTEREPWLSFYVRHQRLLEWSYWPISKSLMAWLRADSVLMEYARRGQALAQWEPYVWEFSSVITGLVAVWLIVLFDRRFSLNSERAGRNLLAHALFSIPVSLVHVVGMVLVRKVTYSALGGTYDFGDWSTELWYEYRKDAVSYINVLLILYIYRFWSTRILQEASPISDNDQTTSAPCERFLVRKMGKDFLLRSSSIEWVEAAGNYMNLHANGRVYPIRQTMSALQESLDTSRFARVHRSFMVNLDFVESIQPADSGDGTIRLTTGEEIRLSRRYRDEIVDKVQTG